MSDQTASRLHEFVSDRLFRLWEFRVSHSMLLVRSARSPETGVDDNVDLIFLGVDYMALPAHLGGVRVTLGSPAVLAQVAAQTARPVSQGTSLYEVASAGKRHHVVAAQLLVAWTTCDIMESSLVLHFSPDEEAERRFRRQHLRSYALLGRQ